MNVLKYCVIFSVAVTFTFSFCWLIAEEAKPKPVSFVKDIKPIFEKRCVHCHNRETLPDRVSFEKAEFAFSKDKFGKVYIVPGKPDQSLLNKAIESPDFHEMMMPMVGLRTTKSETEMIRRWVLEGAKWPKGILGNVKVTFRVKE